MPSRPSSQVGEIPEDDAALSEVEIRLATAPRAAGHHAGAGMMDSFGDALNGFLINRESVYLDAGPGEAPEPTLSPAVHAGGYGRHRPEPHGGMAAVEGGAVDFPRYSLSLSLIPIPTPTPILSPFLSLLPTSSLSPPHSPSIADALTI